MKRLVIFLVVVAILSAAGAAGYQRYYGAKSAAASGLFRTKKVRRSDVTLVVNSTGTVQPVQSVQIGAFVSGPIQKVFVDFNDKVKKDQLLAQIDPRNYKAAVAHEEASLAHSRADLGRVKALYGLAQRVERRALSLKPLKAIAETDYDQSITDRQSLEAQIELGEATIKECEAMLSTAKTNLDFTDIKSPVDGVIIDRKVDPGQTVAAQFQTPVMFIVAPDLEKKVYVYASVDEADIGLIRQAKDRNEPVTFTVDAYPKDTFKGRIAQVRLNSSTVSNVVTYTVVVAAPNEGLKLLPGMTANLAFQIEKHTGVLAVPNGALRFHPKPEQVRATDRRIVEGLIDEEENAHAGGVVPRDRNQHYIWIADGNLLAAVKITTGLSDKSMTEILSGDLKEDQDVIAGTMSAAAKSSGGPPPPPH